MDDISRKLGISKKTLYQYVKDKEDLLSGAVEMFNEHEEQQYEQIPQAGYELFLDDGDEALEV